MGTEGKLGGQAHVEGVAGTWHDLTDNVNGMAGNLTVQLRDIARVATAIANGDLTRKITVEAQGEILQLKNIVNTMVDQLNSFAGEVIRVAREVGTEGVLGGQANVPGVAGTWKNLTDTVNGMATNLTSQVRNIADVTTAVAKGDLSRKITVEAKGEVLALKNTINTMVDQLSAFASEVTRVAREVGTEGILGGQASVPGVSGTWKDLTDNVNVMASNLTNQVRNIAARDDRGRERRSVAEDHRRSARRDARAEGHHQHDGGEAAHLRRRSDARGARSGNRRTTRRSGERAGCRRNVEGSDRQRERHGRQPHGAGAQHRRRDDGRRARRPVAQDHRRRARRDSRAEEHHQHDGRSAQRVRERSDARRARGGHGRKARRPGARCRAPAGVWRDLTDNVNCLASNLTRQVRNIADVTTAVANGDLSQKITVEAQGEVLSLKNTINTMVDRLRVFADEVTRVAKEVGTEGKLGGQAEVPGVAGTWKALTDSVNAMANSLTVQVRNIADVATAVTKGDLTRQITVDAQGELDELKTNINQMIGNLRETTERNQEQDWLKTNLAKFSRMMQGQKDLESRVSRLIMSELTPLVSAHHGAFFIMDRRRGRADAEAHRELRVSRAQARRQSLRARRRARRAGGAREAADPAAERARRLHPDHVRARRSAAAQHHRAARSCSRARSRR